MASEQARRAVSAAAGPAPGLLLLSMQGGSQSSNRRRFPYRVISAVPRGAVARSLSTGAVCVGGEAGNAVAQGKRSRQPAPVSGRRSLRRGWTFARVSGLGPGRCDA